MLQFTVPVLVTTAAHLRVISRLAAGARAASRTLARRRAERARSRQRSAALVTILLVFVSCWLPLNIINLAEDFNPELHCWS